MRNVVRGDEKSWRKLEQLLAKTLEKLNDTEEEEEQDDDGQGLSF